MFENCQAYSGFAVDDLDRAGAFYGETLGLNTSVLQEGVLLEVELPGGTKVLAYNKPDYTPATFTILNFPVDDVAGTVDELAAKGVGFERYDGFEQDERGIDRSGPSDGIAWFKDPAGNILAVHGQL